MLRSRPSFDKIFKISLSPIGAALLPCSISVLILSFLLFLLAHLVVVFIEEPGLKSKFGEDYTNYKKLVGRWVPKIKRPN
jgi:protein-S-isoprenylcysteine O-methyltransferase Ste14